MALYHRNAYGFPEYVEAQLARIGVRNFSYSEHAKQACVTDRHAIIEPPIAANIRPEIVFECEVDKSGRLIKTSLRMDYDEDFDLIIIYLNLTGIVKSVWLNDKHDHHATLNPSNYDKV